MGLIDEPTQMKTNDSQSKLELYFPTSSLANQNGRLDETFLETFEQTASGERTQNYHRPSCLTTNDCEIQKKNLLSVDDLERDLNAMLKVGEDDQISLDEVRRSVDCALARAADCVKQQATLDDVTLSISTQRCDSREENDGIQKMSDGRQG